jgi:hypothetical protein
VIDEELIFATLAERMSQVTWDRGDTVEHKFKAISRRVKLFSDASIQPACYQAEHGTTEEQITSMPYKTTLEASWIIYQNVARDPNAIPAIENNLIIGGCRRALAPTPVDIGYPQRNTLGQLVHHCFISGKIFKDPGDIDGQGMIVIPLKLLVP